MVIYRKLLPQTKKRGVFDLSLKMSSLSELRRIPPRCTITRFQFKKPLPGEHSSEHCCVRTHFQVFMNLADIFFLHWFSEVRKKTFQKKLQKMFENEAQCLCL